MHMSPCSEQERQTVAPLRARLPLPATCGGGNFSTSSSFMWIRSGVFSFSPTIRAVLLFADDASAATAHPLPAVARRFDAAPAAVVVGVRLPRAVRSVPVPVPSSSVSAARLVFPRAARAVVRGASGDPARSVVPSGGLSSAGAGASCFLDLAPARRLVVTVRGRRERQRGWTRR
jgi:hypothetical protein